MKNRSLFRLLVVACFTIVAFTDPVHPIVGRWHQHYSKTINGQAHFRPDGTFDGYINEKLFISGKYYIRQDTFGISDPFCSTKYYGTYKLNFITADSTHLTVIEDTCGKRRRDLDNGRWGRIKTVKP